MRKAEEQAKADALEEERAAAAKEAAHAKALKARDAKIQANPELWTANMPEEYLNGFVQLKMNQIRSQLAQLDESESDSDSD